MIALSVIADFLLVGFGGACLGSGMSACSTVTALAFRDISELTTQSAYFRGRRTLSRDRQMWNWNIPRTHSEYIFSYDGEILSGVDFGQIDVRVNELARTIRETFPEVIISGNSVGEKGMEIYDEDKNIFTPLELLDVDSAIEPLKKRCWSNPAQTSSLERRGKTEKRSCRCSVRCSTARRNKLYLCTRAAG